MKQLLEQEYFHAGTSTILQELWKNPQMDQLYPSYVKPYGGLWTCHNRLDCGRISDWIDYLEEDDPEVFFNMTNSDGCLIKFCDHAKLLEVSSKNDFQNLKDSGFTTKTSSKRSNNSSFSEILDYEKISDYYDLLYVNPFADFCLRSFSFLSMYVMKSEAILYYKKVKANYQKNQILDISEPISIPKLSKEYLKLEEYITTKFLCDFSFPFQDYSDYVYVLYTYVQQFRTRMKLRIPNEVLPNGIYVHQMLDVIVGNLYAKTYREQKLILSK